MFYVLSKILDILLSPLTWAIILVLYGAPLSRRAVRRKKARRWFTLLGLATLYLFSTEPVANALFGHLEDLAVRTEKPDVTYDTVVLLGGLVEDRAMSKEHGVSLNDNVERMLGTLDMYREGRARTIIVSGGAVDDKQEFVEARVLADELVTLGVPRDKIIVEDKAKNTRENALFVAEIAHARGFQKILIVTSAFHMRRARACFVAVGLDVDTLPVDYRAYSPDKYSGSWLPRASSLEHATAALREMSGYYIYRARGYAMPSP